MQICGVFFLLEGVKELASYIDRHSISPDIRDNVDVKRLSPEEYRRYQQIANGNDPDFTDMQNHMWRLAQYASRMAKQNYNFDANPELAGVHNYGGLKDTKGNFRGFISPTM